MSLIVFGSVFFSSEEQTVSFIKQEFFVNGCYMRTGSKVSKTTNNVVRNILGPSDFYAQTFELCDGPSDNTATELFAPKYYYETNGVWEEKAPTLCERLELVQNFLNELFLKTNPVKIKMCISNQGYPILTDCKVIKISLNQLLEKLYDEYEKYNDVPSLLVEIS